MKTSSANFGHSRKLIGCRLPSSKSILCADVGHSPTPGQKLSIMCCFVARAATAGVDTQPQMREGVGGQRARKNGRGGQTEFCSEFIQRHNEVCLTSVYGLFLRQLQLISFLAQFRCLCSVEDAAASMSGYYF